MYVIISELRGSVEGPYPTYGAASSAKEAKGNGALNGWVITPLLPPNPSVDLEAQRCSYFDVKQRQCYRPEQHEGVHDFWLYRD